MLSLESRLLLIFTQWSNCPRPLSIFCKHNTQGLALFKWQKRVALENINCNNCQLASVHSACTRLDLFWNETEIFRTDFYKTFLKGQLISEWNFGFFKSPKKPTKYLPDYCLMKLGQKSVKNLVAFLGDLKTPKIHSEIKWTLTYWWKEHMK